LFLLQGELQQYRPNDDPGVLVHRQVESTAS